MKNLTRTAAETMTRVEHRRESQSGNRSWPWAISVTPCTSPGTMGTIRRPLKRVRSQQKSLLTTPGVWMMTWLTSKTKSMRWKQRLTAPLSWLLPSQARSLWPKHPKEIDASRYQSIIHITKITPGARTATKKMLNRLKRTLFTSNLSASHRGKGKLSPQSARSRWGHSKASAWGHAKI